MNRETFLNKLTVFILITGLLSSPTHAKPQCRDLFQEIMIGGPVRETIFYPVRSGMYPLWATAGYFWVRHKQKKAQGRAGDPISAREYWRRLLRRTPHNILGFLAMAGFNIFLPLLADIEDMDEASKEYFETSPKGLVVFVNAFDPKKDPVLYKTAERYYKKKFLNTPEFEKPIYIEKLGNKDYEPFDDLILRLDALRNELGKGVSRLDIHNHGNIGLIFPGGKQLDLGILLSRSPRKGEMIAWPKHGSKAKSVSFHSFMEEDGMVRLASCRTAFGESGEAYIDHLDNSLSPHPLTIYAFKTPARDRLPFAGIVDNPVVSTVAPFGLFFGELYIQRKDEITWGERWEIGGDPIYKHKKE